MKINLLVLENNISSWKMYWREDPPILKMNRKQLQLWLFLGARLKENSVFCNSSALSNSKWYDCNSQRVQNLLLFVSELSDAGF